MKVLLAFIAAIQAIAIAAFAALFAIGRNAGERTA